MKKAMRSLLSVLLVVALVCTILPVALADAPASPTFAVTASSGPVDAGGSYTVTASGVPTVEDATLKEGSESYTWTGSAGLTVTGTGASATATAAAPGSYTVACAYSATYVIPAAEPAEGEEPGESTEQTVTATANTTLVFQGITLDKAAVTVAVGGTASVVATAWPQNSFINWSSSDNTIATVNNGTIRGVTAGTATITASYDTTHTATCTVTVVSAPAITTQPVSAAYNTGATNVTPLSVVAATPATGALTYAWYRDNQPIASATGASYTPDVSTAGTHTYYCVVTNGNVSTTSASATITVRDEYTVTINESNVTTATGSVAVGGSLYLFGTVTRNIPVGATFSVQTVSASQLVWSSADTTRVRVTNSWQGGTYTGASCTAYGVASSPAGTAVTATYTAPSNSSVPGKTYSASYTVKVQDQIEVTFTKNPASVLLGATTRDTAVATVVDKSANRTCSLTSYPSYNSGYTYTVSYSSDNSYTATVDATGATTGRTAGQTTIRALVRVYNNGTLVAEVTATCPVTVYEGGVDYYVANGGSVNFKEDDFNTFFQKTYPRNTLSYVVFNMDSAVNCNSSIYGYLYSSYTGSYKTPVTGNRTAFYYNASSNQYDLDSLVFSAGTRTGSYTVAIPFTAYGTTSRYGTETQSVSGCVYIYVNAGHSITYLGTGFRSEKIVSEVSQAYPGAAYVQFTLPARDEGKLFYNYTSIAKYNHAVDAKTRYYLSAANTQYALESVYFVPAADLTSGSGVTVSYTAYNAYGNSLGTGKLFFTVTGQTASNYFSDVTAKNTGSWSANAIDFLYYNGLVSGTGTRTFSPEQTMTRGMLVTMLYNAAGQPSVAGYTNPFKDVSTKDYFYNAVLWASRTGVVYGTSTTTFSPNDSVTREQIASFLYRYAKGSASSYYSLTGYTDSGKISSYALPAMKWAVQNGYISGYNKQLNPTGNATRAEVSSMLHRFLTLS